MLLLLTIYIDSMRLWTVPRPGCLPVCLPVCLMGIKPGSLWGGLFDVRRIKFALCTLIYAKMIPLLVLVMLLMEKCTFIVVSTARIRAQKPCRLHDKRLQPSIKEVIIIIGT